MEQRDMIKDMQYVEKNRNEDHSENASSSPAHVGSCSGRTDRLWMVVGFIPDLSGHFPPLWSTTNAVSFAR